MADQDCSLSELDGFCKDAGIRYTATPVEMKKRLAEVWFREHFKAADTMLWEARLSPCFWADAIAYSNYLAIRTPNSHVGPTTPWTMVTGERARWDKFRVFGSDCYRHRPNNPYSKVPGLPVGQKLIFMGFCPTGSGYRVFDPETRNYYSTDNVYFYENMSHRIDALRHHDKRRELLRRGEDQPYVLNDFDDDNATAVRSLYLDPNASPPRVDAWGESSDPPELSAGTTGGSTSILPSTGPAVRPLAPRLEGAVSRSSEDGPLSDRSLLAEHGRERLRQGVLLRPLRLLPVGREAPFEVSDQQFFEYMERVKAPIVYLDPCPKKQKGSACRRRYLRYMSATTLTEALELGSTRDDLRHDYRRGYIRFPKHESDLPGHVFAAFELAAEHGYTHILQDVGRRVVRKSVESDCVIARAYSATAADSLSHPGRSFQQILTTVFEP
jgi:hypothetical protein